MADWSAVLPEIARQGVAVNVRGTPRSVGGGDISDAWRVDGPDGHIFLKTGPADASASFSAEVDGLSALAASGSIRVPPVLGTGRAGPLAWLALQWLDLGSATADSDRELGRQLARLHRTTSDTFGWPSNNFIGATAQVNTPCDDWATFYAEHRLGFQLRTGARFGYGGELQQKGSDLVEAVPALLADHQPASSLLHGDLWSGNRAAVDGKPVIFDPAVYYGDRETDLAMTRLFGGFSAEFYRAYEEEWPLPDGWEQRVSLYQLYHVLNHLNLFGQGYLSRALALIDESLAAVSRR